MQNFKKKNEDLSYPDFDAVFTHAVGVLEKVKISEFKYRALTISSGHIYLFDLKKEAKVLNFIIQNSPEYMDASVPRTIVLFNYDSARKDKIAFESSHYFEELSKAIKIVTHGDCRLVYNLSYNKKEKPIKFFRPFDLSNKNDILDRNNYSHIKSPKDLRIINSVFNGLLKLPIDNGINHTPILNAVRFLNHAQNEPWLSLKITLFFIALESLFSDDKEISFKVSLRASYFLFPKDKEKRNRVFHVLKNGYSLRSDFVHGLENSENKIAKKLSIGNDSYSIMLDFPEELNSIVCDIVKRILIDEKLFDLFSNKKHDVIDRYLNSLVL